MELGPRRRLVEDLFVLSPGGLGQGLRECYKCKVLCFLNSVATHFVMHTSSKMRVLNKPYLSGWALPQPTLPAEGGGVH